MRLCIDSTLNLSLHSDFRRGGEKVVYLDEFFSAEMCGFWVPLIDDNRTVVIYVGQSLNTPKNMGSDTGCKVERPGWEARGKI